jgi:hypothetical protein
MNDNNFIEQINKAVSAHVKSWDKYVSGRLTPEEIEELKAAAAAEYEAWLDRL